MNKRKPNVVKDLKFSSPFKALMMIFVILGHSSIIYTGFWSTFLPTSNSPFFDFLTRWLDTFHTYAFVFVSGYIFYYLKYIQEKYDNNKKLIVNKAKRLIVPYVITCCFWAIPVWTILNDFDSSTLISKYLIGENPDQLWFLLMLFWVFVMTIIILQFISFDKLGLLGLIVLTGGAFALYLISVVMNAASVANILQIISALGYVMYFIAGMVCGKVQNKYKRRTEGFIFAILEITLLCLSLGGAHLHNYVFHGILKYLLFPLCSFAGVLFWFFLVQRMVSYRQARKSTSQTILMNCYNFFVDKYFYIYLLHQQLIYIILKIINKPGVAPFFVVLCNFVIALLLSCVICILIEKGKKLLYKNMSSHHYQRSDCVE